MNLKSIKLHHLKSTKNDFESHKFLWYLKKKELALDVLGQSQESMHTIPLTNGKPKHNLKCNFFSEIKFSIPSSNFLHPLIYQVCWGASACTDYSLSSKTIKKSKGNKPITSGCIWGKGGILQSSCLLPDITIFKTSISIPTSSEINVISHNVSAFMFGIRKKITIKHSNFNKNSSIP